MKNRITIIVCILAATIFGSWMHLQPAKADTVGRRNITDLKYMYFYSLSGTAPYVRWINKQQGSIYDNTNSVLSATATWTDTDIALTTKMTTIGGWQAAVPASLPDGAYDLLLYDVSTAAGSRANTDAIARGKHVIVENAIITQMSDI